MTKILLTGGGTGGATTPLLAIAEVLKRRDPKTDFLFVGTPSGPEAELVRSAGLSFESVKAPKLRRYWDIQNVVDVGRAPLALWRAWRIFRRFRPSVILSVGSYVSVPFALVGKVMGIPLLIHQQDLRKGLANRIMTPFADRITVTFEASRDLFPSNRTYVTGNPIRETILHGDDVAFRKRWNITPNENILLVMGGGTGALALNTFVHHHLLELTKSAVVIHLTGKGKGMSDSKSDRYRPVELITNEMGDLLAAADLILTRAGVATLSEGLTLGKAMIVVPMPGTHQEENADLLEQHSAALVIPQVDLETSETLSWIRSLLTDQAERERRGRLASRLLPKKAAERVADILSILLFSRYGGSNPS